MKLHQGKGEKNSIYEFVFLEELSYLLTYLDSHNQ